MVLTSALATPEMATGLVACWNKRDAGKWLWKWELCLPDSFDYPLRDNDLVAIIPNQKTKCMPSTTKSAARNSRSYV
jgi:hypothetical protein